MYVQAKFGLRFPRWASGLSESAKDLLRQLLGRHNNVLPRSIECLSLTYVALLSVPLTEVDSSNRYTAEQALAHPWVTGARTPNKFLKSPNYLRSIKQEQVSQKMNGRVNGMQFANGNGVDECAGNGLPISVRRQSR